MLLSARRSTRHVKEPYRRLRHVKESYRRLRRVKLPLPLLWGTTSGPKSIKYQVKHAPKPCKTQPVALPNPSKSRSGAPRGVKIHPGNDPDQPRHAQERPRSGQEAPKKRPRRAKRRPRAPKSLPRSAPDPSKSEAGEPRDKFLACFFGEVLRERLLKRFGIVF